MSRFKRISVLHLLASIFLLGLITLVLTLLSPGAKVTGWLSNHWQSIGLAIALLYLGYRILGDVRHKRKLLGNVPDQAIRQDYQVWTGNEPARSDIASGSMEWLRARVLNEAGNLSVPDAVYRVVTYNNSCSLPFKIEPGELPWLASVEQFEELARRANKLRRAAYHVGDAGMRNDGSYDAARDRLLAENPGFSEVTYMDAITYGYQMAR